MYDYHVSQNKHTVFFLLPIKSDISTGKKAVKKFELLDFTTKIVFYIYGLKQKDILSCRKVNHMVISKTNIFCTFLAAGVVLRQLFEPFFDQNKDIL
jgi:hypothetical protein